jgi:hypothetical protein
MKMMTHTDKNFYPSWQMPFICSIQTIGLLPFYVLPLKPLRFLENFALLDYQAIALDPKNAEVFVDRGVAYSRLGEHQKAIEDL